MELERKASFVPRKTPLRPISLYGKTKVDAEKEVLSRDNSISFPSCYCVWHGSTHAA